MTQYGQVSRNHQDRPTRGYSGSGAPEDPSQTAIAQLRAHYGLSPASSPTAGQLIPLLFEQFVDPNWIVGCAISLFPHSRQSRQSLLEILQPAAGSQNHDPCTKCSGISDGHLLLPPRGVHRQQKTTVPAERCTLRIFVPSTSAFSTGRACARSEDGFSRWRPSEVEMQDLHSSSSGGIQRRPSLPELASYAGERNGAPAACLPFLLEAVCINFATDLPVSPCAIRMSDCSF